MIKKYFKEASVHAIIILLGLLLIAVFEVVNRLKREEQKVKSIKKSEQWQKRKKHNSTQK